MRDVTIDVRVRGRIAVYTQAKKLMNSEGLDLELESTGLSIYANMVSNENDIIGGSVSDTYEGHNIEYDFENFGSKLAQRAVLNHQGKTIHSFTGDIILVGDAASLIIDNILSPAFSGENILTKRSPFDNKMEQQLFNPDISLISDGTLNAGLYSSPFDDEGCPTTQQPLIKNGVIKGFMTDYETAKGLGGDTSTGNARRPDPENPPKILPLNLIFSEGDTSLDKAIRSIKQGLIVRRISGNGSFVTGNISGIAKEAAVIENGEVSFAVRKTMIAGNLYNWLKEQLTPLKGAEQRAHLIIPPILISNTKIVGSK